MSYHVSYKDPLTGKKKHYKTYHRLKDALTSANELRILINNGNLPKERKSNHPLSFAEVADEAKIDLLEDLTR